MNKLTTLNAQLQSLEDELDDLYAMSEEAACFRYLVTYKEEAIEALEEEMQHVRHLIAEAEAEDAPHSLIDPAFTSIHDLNLYLY